MPLKKIDISKQFNWPLENSITVNKKDIDEILATQLYRKGILSGKEARQIVKKTRREFDDLLVSYNIPTIGDSEEDIEIERRSYL